MLHLVNKEDNKLRVLVVERDPDVQTLVHCVLSPHFDLDLAFGFDEALMYASEQIYDLLLVELSLGEARGGVALVKTLRKMLPYQDVPMLAFTTLAEMGQHANLIQQGFSGFVSKPFTRTELLHTLQEAAGLLLRPHDGPRLVRRLQRMPLGKAEDRSPMRLLQRQHGTAHPHADHNADPAPLTS